jgi:ligand-binding sensor domain-containing protein/signal transduction histidine kinase
MAYSSFMKHLFLLFLLLTSSLLSQAQQEQIHFKRISLKEGLSQSTVRCSLKDKEGYMWFSTLDGLNRYDGYQMTVFRNDPKNPASLSSNMIHDILEDKAGNLWVATSKGIDRFDRQQETFIHHPLGDHPFSVGDILQDRQGNLLITIGDQLLRWEKDHFQFFREVSSTYRMTEDDQGDLWLLSWDKIQRLNLRTQQVSNYPTNPSSVYNDSQGNLWVGTHEEGLWLYNRQTDSFTRFVHDENNPNSLCLNRVLSLAEGPDGRLWIGTQNGGISLFDYPNNRFSTIRQNIDDPTSLSNNSVHSLYKDYQGNMWAGTWAGGVNMYSPYAGKFVHYQKILHFNNPNMYAVTGDQQGQIWISVEDGGLVRLDRRTGQFTHYPNPHQREFTTDVIFSIADYGLDSLAIGYSVANFAFFNKRTGSFDHFFQGPAHPGISGTTKPILLHDHEHNLWMGDWGNGLNFFDHHNRQFTTYRWDPNNPNSCLSNNVVFGLCEDHQGNVWVGTEGGLNCFDRRSGKFVQYQHDERNPHSLSNNTVLSLLVDHQGTLWVGTEQGLNRLEEKTNRFTRYTRKDGLPSDAIKGMLEDAKGNLWLSTNKGLSRFNPQRKTFRNYDVNDGLQVEEFNRNACYKAADGTMFFAGITGLNIFHPDSLRENPNIPPVVITGFQIFNQSVNLADKDSPLQQSISQTKELTLSYQQSVFTFEFAALNFILPGKNQYAYQLEGFDQAWNHVGTKRTATYTNLDANTYTFRVKASNNDGVWNEQGTSLIIHILPPWWKTWWFRTAAAFVLGGMAIAYYRLRIRTIKRRNRKLERLVLEKTHQLQSANEELVVREEEITAQNEELSIRNDQLLHRQEEIASQRDLLSNQNQKLNEARQTIEEQNEEILLHNQTLDQEVKERTKELVEYNQQLEQFAFIAAHNLRAPVARILGLGQILELSRNNPDDEKMIVDKLIFTTEELDKVVKDVNTILTIRKNNTLAIAEINLTEELKLIKALLANEITDTQTEIREDFSQANVIHTVKPYLDSILVNLLSNAIKYRDTIRKPQIQVTTETCNGYVCLLVSDNGLGIDLQHHQKNMFSLYKRFHYHVEGKGMGLYLVKTQVVALGGKIEVESKVNKGTTFKVFLKNNGAQQVSELHPSGAVVG